MRRAPKHQAPNTKLQGSSKSQAPNQGPSDVLAIQGSALRFGAWNFSGAWDLKLPRRVIPPKTAKTQFVGYCSLSVIRNTRLIGSSLTIVCLLPEGQSTSTA